MKEIYDKLKNEMLFSNILQVLKKLEKPDIVAKFLLYRFNFRRFSAKIEEAEKVSLILDKIWQVSMLQYSETHLSSHYIKGVKDEFKEIMKADKRIKELYAILYKLTNKKIESFDNNYDLLDIIALNILIHFPILTGTNSNPDLSHLESSLEVEESSSETEEVEEIEKIDELAIEFSKLTADFTNIIWAAFAISTLFLVGGLTK